jgi:tRNA-uridine 2-sulfurtransferase
MPEKLKIVVAMSGGVDSSVTAALLQEQGYDVIGVTFHLRPDLDWDAALVRDSGSASDDARRVAEFLKIPFSIVDARDEFRRRVLDYVIREYAAGRTPIPCVVCNREIKWTTLFAEALRQSAGYVATGHYARVERLGEVSHLLRARDSHKDQSYMLSALDQSQLSRTVFPLGTMTKQEVRGIAHRIGLPVADRPESQDLCFVPDGDYRAFLRAQRPDLFLPGSIVNTSGAVLGQHEGLAGYTIGQRRGIRVSASEPMYVQRIDPSTNTLTVGYLHELGHRVLIGDTIHWISGEPPTESFRAQVRIRYAARETEAEVIPQSNGSLRVEFPQPLRDITPGQAVVFYQDEECLGMAFIQEARE